MKVQERNAVVKVIKSRFEVLRKQALRLRDDLKQAIYDRTLEENERKLAAAKRDMAKIQERAEKLKADAQEVVAKHRENGLRLGTVELRQAYRGGKYEEEMSVNESKEKDPFTFTVTNDWYPYRIGLVVERELAELERAHGMGQLSLAKREQELVEEVILGGVEDTVTAHEFLARVPNLDTLPKPDDVRKLPV